MEAVYGWVKNIIYYMIFLSVVNNLLADSKYGKYIRFFSGMVLILLVVSPFTGGLHLDEQISSMFKSISFQNDTDDLKQDLWGMEERRLDQVIREYEQAVAADVEGLKHTVWISTCSKPLPGRNPISIHPQPALPVPWASPRMERIYPNAKKVAKAG